jgi:hypothetical protein
MSSVRFFQIGQIIFSVSTRNEGKFLIKVQLRTTKVNKLSISGTRIFDGNLTTDLKLDRQKELKTGLFILFPHVFGRAKNLSDILSFGNCSSRSCRVHQDIDDHHDQGVGDRASVEINPSHEVVGFLTCIPKEDVTRQPSLNTLILIPACAFCAFDYN